MYDPSGSRINPTWFTLGSSRGIETPNSTVFMRSSVLVLDALIYIPALLMFTKIWQGNRSKRTQVSPIYQPENDTRLTFGFKNVTLLTLLLQPALLLVDFGHFQYNSVMLGMSHLVINWGDLTALQV